MRALGSIAALAFLVPARVVVAGVLVACDLVQTVVDLRRLSARGLL